MNLQEIAFMTDLIKKNYRRRMGNLFLNIVALVVPLSLFLGHSPVFAERPYMLPFSFIISLISGLRFLFVYCLDGPKFPWQIKKSQATALREVVSGKGDFEQLGSRVPLGEYFCI